jgi:stage III sporulation protein AG
VSQENKKGNIFEQFMDFWQDGAKGGKKKSYILLSFLLLGIILMFSSPFFTSQRKLPVPRDNYVPEVPSVFQEQKSCERELTEALGNILEHIDGISNVEVFISFDSSEEIVYAQSVGNNSRETSEVDREGGRREIYEDNKNSDYIILRDAGGGEKPLQLRKNMPAVKGVLVVANGADNCFLRLKIIRAIESVLELPAHRIAVLPRGSS